MSGSAPPQPQDGAATPATRAAPVQGDLVRVVARMPEPVFAVVDGGHFDDVTAVLGAAGLASRSLFLGEAGREAELAGPWLVPIAREGDAVKVLGVVGELPAVVFWSCAQGDAALYDHLRRLNMARLPTWAAAGKDGPEPGVAADLAYEAVLFRHWDPRVLGALLPVLDEGQFSRILGPAAEITYFAADHGGAKRVVADPDWPLAPAGLLTITSDQVGALVERRVEAQRRRVAKYLRDVTGNELAQAPEVSVHRHVLQSEAGARELGLVTESGRCRWAYLMYATRGRVAQQPDLIHLIRHGEQAPDQQIKSLMDATIRGLREEQQALLRGTSR